MKKALTTLLWVAMLIIGLSGCQGGEGEDNSVGEGPSLKAPIDLEIGADGQLIVLDLVGQDEPRDTSEGTGAVLRVDPLTGDRFLVASDKQGNGPNFFHPFAIAAEADGRIVVAEGTRNAMVGLRAVLRIDPVTGNRTIVSDDRTGSGTSLIIPLSIAVEADGHLLVAEPTHQAVFRIDPATGDRSVVTGCHEPEFFGPPLSFVPPRYCPDGLIVGHGPLLEVITFVFLAIEPDGYLLISGWDLTLLRVDPITGDRTIVTGCTDTDLFDDLSRRCIGELIGTGPLPGEIGPVAVESDGRLIIGLRGGALLRVDPLTGDRAIISNASMGSGPALPQNPTDIVVEADGNLILTGYNAAANGFRVYSAIMRVDPATGDRSLVSGLPNGSMPVKLVTFHDPGIGAGGGSESAFK